MCVLGSRTLNEYDDDDTALKFLMSQQKSQIQIINLTQIQIINLTIRRRSPWRRPKTNLSNHQQAKIYMYPYITYAPRGESVRIGILRTGAYGGEGVLTDAPLLVPVLATKQRNTHYSAQGSRQARNQHAA